MPTDSLARLPAIFTYSQARHHGLSDRRLYALRDSGAVEPLGRGLFRRADASVDADPDLLEIAYRADLATLCLTTALARHGLTDAIPSRIDVALPRGHRQPQTRAPVAWHSFAADTFTVGRDEIDLTAQLTLGIYNPQRCLIDVFRLRHHEGHDLAHEALRRWLRRTDAQPAKLLSMARAFPGAEPALRAALEILL
ncbi:MAG: type IV toxin-antitoxin system AbiEi family antitoxin domain-containing protein [Actinoallomurus sp.]